MDSGAGTGGNLSGDIRLNRAEKEADEETQEVTVESCLE